jgi:hypothetical protein
MDSCDDTPKGWVAPFGHPRINACSRLPVAFRSVPRPSSPPGAKASTECPSLARDLSPGLGPENHHAQKPSSAVTDHQAETAQAESLSLSTQQSPLNTAPSLNAEAFGQTSRWSRPETHQNLIHPDKERRLPFGDTSGIAVPHRTINADCFRFSAIPSDQPDTPTPETRVVVEVIGLEPTTPCLQSRCSPS